MKIRNLLLILFVLMAATPLLIVGVRDIQLVDRLVAEEILAEEQEVLALEQQRFADMVRTAEAHAFLLGGVPPVQGLIRATETGVDPVDGSTYEEWESRLATIFEQLLIASPTNVTVQYIDVEGNEMVRVDRTDRGVEPVRAEALRDQADQDYVKAINSLDPGELYVSSLNLYQELGNAAASSQPIMRFGAAVFDEETGERRGMIVRSVDMSAVLAALSESPHGHRLIADVNGYYLLHPDESKTFGFIHGTNNNLYKDVPELLALHENLANPSRTHLINGTYYIEQSLQVGNNTWFIFTVVSEEEVLAPVTEVRDQLILVSVISILLVTLIALLTANLITAPLREMTDGAEEIARGNFSYRVNLHKMKVGKKTELGRLALAFNKMAARLQRRFDKNMEETDSKDSDGNV